MQVHGREGAREPQDYSRRLLVAVTGMSPQIVTETLYALAVAQTPPFIPTGIRLITTEAGAKLARQKLLEPGSAQVRRLCADYGLPTVEFESAHVMVIEDSRGQPMSDIRDLGDNTRAANTIAAAIRDFTQDEDSALHVSIAGGRKTMGFYMGYALSLFGRAQDRLSHVLVNPPFESAPDFFYPTPEASVVRDREGNCHDGRDAKVTLADIPFVRLRAGLNLESQIDKVSFTALVEEAQRTLLPSPPVSLKLNLDECMVTADNVSFKLQPALFAFYWMLAELAQKGQPFVHWLDDNYTDKLAIYRKRVGIYDDDNFLKCDEDKQKYTYEIRSKIKTALERHLGKRHAARYLIGSGPNPPRSGYKPFGLSLPSEAIFVEGR